ncbi:RNA polymerase sigma factor [Leptospira kmetyi]|uniref:Sigma-70 family RNA polymerase sigma factor n=1 Tax=Leptospira kmetyi TaxID=408139 RepID=A0A2M9XL86_9LEPT|nr:sigma-70 family RNA polymerase sigma factor [Leptospira kmetyi]AYV55089.1 sigma-70 family RNA polymerase sigma factor [Leptospira kmetyi]EQA52262.1 sigma-70 region 2 [Leptospira kmetyi serovar Malaysia str. Bejo-Iso9]PJZ28224.1 sigma-70 family RNA polymerase sigma factor [Leptospira kmetyi]PJZ40085.1 sigma-70 family RNA polymerase sigma factor [Leptospira kmetyi]TGK19501.1 sigma-70 family RNA polymerase sigma factor [Leptospira kmetyi]
MNQNTKDRIFDFDGLYSRNYEKIFRFLLSKNASREEAEEVCQETFIKVLKHWDKFDPSKGNETSWMITIAKNLFLDWIKKKGPIETREVFDSQKVLESVSKEQTNANDEEEMKRRLEILNESVESLPHLEKNIIVLRFLRKHTIKETAELLGISVRTVNRKTYASLTVLRRILKKSNLEFEGL